MAEDYHTVDIIHNESVGRKEIKIIISFVRGDLLAELEELSLPGTNELNIIRVI
jgi:hypothetical protein